MMIKKVFSLRFVKLIKKTCFYFSLVLLSLLLVSCGSSYLFPDDTALWNERQKTYTKAKSEVESASELNFNFYIQTTSYMAGFITDKNSNYSQILLSATSPTVINPLVGNSGVKSFYRFDAKNYDTDNGYEPYEISNVQFQNYSLSDKSFYTIKWYFTQEARYADKYKRYYEEALATSPNRIYDYDVALNDAGGYLRKTMDYLDNNPDSISVIFTDLVDAKFQTDELMRWLAEYVSSDSQKSVSVFAFKIPYNGKVYSTESPVSYNGDRPFYVLVLGNVSNAEKYCSSFQADLEGKGLMGEHIMISASKVVRTAMNYVDSDDLIVETDDSIRLKDRRLLQNNDYLHETERSVYKNDSFRDTLFYKVNPAFDDENTIEITYKLPLYKYDFWTSNNENPKIPLELDVDIAVAEREGGEGNIWEKYDKSTAEIVKNSKAIVTDDGEISLSLYIDKEALRKIGPLDKDNRFRLNIKVKNNILLVKPQWINEYFYDGIIKSGRDDQSILGSHTIMPVSGLIDELIHAANVSDTQNNVVADLLLYLIY